MAPPHVFSTNPLWVGVDVCDLWYTEAEREVLLAHLDYDVSELVEFAYEMATEPSVVGDMCWCLDNGIRYTLRIDPTFRFSYSKRSYSMTRLKVSYNLKILLHSDRDAVLFKLFRR